MFISSKDSLINNELKKDIINKKIDIEDNITWYLIISWDNNKVLNPIQNKIIDLILDNINSKDIHQKFSVILENINYFIKNIKLKEEKSFNLNILIWVSHENVFYFSKIWESSCYLINKSWEIIELSESRANEEFDYVSSWKVSAKERIILSNLNIIDALTPSDVKDLHNLDTIIDVNNSILNILKEEYKNENITISIIAQEDWVISESNKINLNEFLYKIIDNNIWKKIYAFFQMLLEKINQKWKVFKNVVFLSWIIISFYFLFTIIWSVVDTTQNSSKVAENKTNLIEAREFMRLATQNLTNPDMFQLNVDKSEELVKKVINDNMFQKETETILSELSIIKKQFNGIETFTPSNVNRLVNTEITNGVQIINKDRRLYIIWENKIIWPIVWWQTPEIYEFNDLEVWDKFIQATVSWSNIVILTKNSRIVNFSNTNNFSYANVVWQDKWQESSILEWYNGNLYLVNQKANQLYRHRPITNWFASKEDFLSREDSENIWEIIWVWIDWWIYLLKNDLTLVKLFRSPSYRLESIVLNNLPSNYSHDGWRADIIASNTLNYVYFLLNNKIWIFEPNTTRFMDTKSLKYKWQIEASGETIISFDIPRDWEINILTNKWVYKTNFELDWDRVIIR